MPEQIMEIVDVSVEIFDNNNNDKPGNRPGFCVRNAIFNLSFVFFSVFSFSFFFHDNFSPFLWNGRLGLSVSGTVPALLFPTRSFVWPGPPPLVVPWALHPKTRPLCRIWGCGWRQGAALGAFTSLRE